MGKIVAIGGGELSPLKTLNIDKQIVRLAQKGSQHPWALFIPTASGENKAYINSFNRVYGEMLGCITDSLLVLNFEISKQQIEDKIFTSDLIYVGGGDTIKMLDTWRQLGIDSFLKTAYRNGIVISGLSAGAMCWFKYAQSEVQDGSNLEKLSYVRVSGLGFLDAFFCPHFNNARRKIEYVKMLNRNEVGVALEDNCAIEFNEDKFRILRGEPESKAFKLSRTSDKVNTDELYNTEEYMPLSGLLKN